MGAFRSLVAAAGVVVIALAARADTFVVAPGDSIQAAIDGAAAGDTIVIKPGIYNESFTIAKTLTIKGSPGKTILDGAGLGSFIGDIASGVEGCVFTGLTFRWPDAGNCSLYGPAGHNGTVVTKCTFLGNPEEGVNFGGGDDLRVLKCTFRGNDGGVYIDAGTGHELSGNRHSAENDYGEESFGPFTAMKSFFDRTTTDSAYYAGATATLTGARVTRCYAGVDTGNGPTGVLVDRFTGTAITNEFVYLDGTDCTIRDCRARNVADDAFRLSGSGGTIQDSTAWFPYSGVNLDGGGHTVTGNSLSMCYEGIYASNSPSGVGGTVIENNSVRECWDYGVYGNSFGGTVRGNRIWNIGAYGDQESGGVRIYRGDGALVEANSIGDVDGGSGVSVEYSDNVIVRDNEIEDVGFCGVFVRGQYTYYNYYLSTSGLEVRGNTIRGTSDPFSGAIELRGVSAGTVDGNTIADAGGTGIRLNGITATTISNNVIDGTTFDGIHLFNDQTSGDNVISGNTVGGAGTEGIQNDASPGAGTTITNNSVTGSGLAPFANAGTVNTGASTGNSPQPADWNAIPPRHYE